MVSHADAEALIDKYRAALDAFDLDKAISCANLPALFVSNSKSTACKTADELETIFKGIFKQHRKRGYQRADYTIENTVGQGPHSCLTVIRWRAYDSEDKQIWDFKASYNLLATSNGLRIVAFTAHN